MKDRETVKEIIPSLKKRSDQAPVSVIIPCYNRQDTIRRAVLSVVKQTWKPKELILIDDGSTDDTLKVVKSLQNEFGEGWIKVITLPKNSGPSIARNKAWEIATQPYLAFLDSDDVWNQDKIAIQMHYMLNHESVFLNGHRYLVSKQGREYDFSELPFSQVTIKEIGSRRLLFHNCYSPSGVILKRSLSHRFPSSKRYSEDYSLWLSIVFDGYSAVFTNLPLAYGDKLYFGERGLSGHLWNLERDHNKNYLRLLQQKKIGLLMTLLAIGWSLLKYIRRVLIIYFFKVYYRK